MKYDVYNREERALCSHLFRLLHEGLTAASDTSPLRSLLRLLASRDLTFTGAAPPDLLCVPLAPAAILAEVSLIRDAYQVRKPEVAPFMDALVALVARQEGIGECRTYSALPTVLCDPRKTHPAWIAKKGGKLGLLKEAELRVYGALQGMFNATPDLAIVLPNCFIVFEAKFTEKFDEVQLRRTRTIAEVWSTLLHDDLGFNPETPFAVATLGDAACGVDVSWQELLPIANETYPVGDRSRAAFEHAVALLGRRRTTR